jgi:hypothetical protein
MVCRGSPPSLRTLIATGVSLDTMQRHPPHLFYDVILSEAKDLAVTGSLCEREVLRRRAACLP